MAFNWRDPQAIQTARQKAIDAGYKPAEVDKFIQQKVTENAQVQLSQQGVLDVGDLAKTSPQVALQAVQQGATPKVSQNTEAQKNQKALDATMNLINNLEKHYQAAEGGDTNLGPITRLLGIGKDIKGAVGLNKDVNLYNREKKGFAATLKSLTGDTGVLTDQDYKRLSELLPDMKSTSQEAPGLFNDLRSQIAAKYGGAPTQTSFQPHEKNALQALLPETAQFAQGVGQQAQGIGQLAQTDPRAAAQQAQSQGMAYAQNANPVNLIMNLLGGQKEARSVLAPTNEIAQNLGAISGGASLLGAAKSLPGKIFPAGAASATRTGVIDSATKAGNTIDGQVIADHFAKWGEQAIKGNPGKEKQVANIVNSVTANFANKKITPEDAFKIWLDSNNGYNAQGVTKTALESKVDVAMREALRPLLEKAAPGFDEATKAIATGMRNKKVGSWIAKTLGGGVVSTAGGVGLGVLLSRRPSQ